MTDFDLELLDGPWVKMGQRKMSDVLLAPVPFVYSAPGLRAVWVLGSWWPGEVGASKGVGSSGYSEEAEGLFAPRFCGS